MRQSQTLTGVFGTLIDFAGDNFMAAFKDAKDAVQVSTAYNHKSSLDNIA